MIEDLIFNNETKKEIEVNKQKMVIRLLDNEEMIEIFEKISNIKVTMLKLILLC